MEVRKKNSWTEGEMNEKVIESILYLALACSKIENEIHTPDLRKSS